MFYNRYCSHYAFFRVCEVAIATMCTILCNFPMWIAAKRMGAGLKPFPPTLRSLYKVDFELDMVQWITRSACRAVVRCGCPWDLPIFSKIACLPSLSHVLLELQGPLVPALGAPYVQVTDFLDIAHPLTAPYHLC